MKIWRCWMIYTRAATDMAYLNTRIQNSRCGSVKNNYIFAKFSIKTWAHKICSEIFNEIFSLKAVLKSFMNKSFLFKNLQKK